MVTMESGKQLVANAPSQHIWPPHRCRLAAVCSPNAPARRLAHDSLYYRVISVLRDVRCHTCMHCAPPRSSDHLHTTTAYYLSLQPATMQGSIRHCVLACSKAEAQHPDFKVAMPITVRHELSVRTRAQPTRERTGVFAQPWECPATPMRC